MEAAVEKRSSTDQSKEEWTGADEGGQEEETEFCKETVESDATPPHRMAAQYPIDGSSPPSSQDSLDMMLTYADDDALEAWAKQQEKKGSFCGLVFDSPLLSLSLPDVPKQHRRGPDWAERWHNTFPECPIPKIDSVHKRRLTPRDTREDDAPGIFATYHETNLGPKIRYQFHIRTYIPTRTHTLIDDDDDRIGRYEYMSQCIKRKNGGDCELAMTEGVNLDVRY